MQVFTPAFLDYLFKQAKRHSAKDLRRSLPAPEQAPCLLLGLDAQRRAVAGGAHLLLRRPPAAPQHEAKAVLAQQFHEASTLAKQRFACDVSPTIQDGKLKLKRDDKVALPPAVTTLQKVINARLPLIRIEQLFMEVDHLTGFSRHFTPVHGYQARPPQFYKTLLAALISQATNLGVVSMSASVQGSLSTCSGTCCRSSSGRTRSLRPAPSLSTAISTAIERRAWDGHPLLLGCPTLWHPGQQSLGVLLSALLRLLREGHRHLHPCLGPVGRLWHQGDFL